MEKADYKKRLKHLYSPSRKDFSLVDVPSMKFIMLDGAGDPNIVPIFQEITSTLYAVAYTIKFILKKKGFDFAVMPLEGLWWAEDMGSFSLERKEDWLWTLMILQPDEVSEDIFIQARLEAGRKKDLPLLERLRFERYHEGLAVQILYLGAYADEGPTIARMHAFIAEQGYRLEGKHHEIYLGDPRRTTPEKLKTVIRQPVRS